MAIGQNVTIRCPHCRRRLAENGDFAGKIVTCPGCHEPFRFPLLSASDGARSEAAKLGYRYIDLEKNEISADILKMVPEQIARDNHFLPVAIEGETLTVAMSSPPSPEQTDRLRFLLNRAISVVLANDTAINQALNRYYHPSEGDVIATSIAPKEEAIDFVEMGDQASSAQEILDPDDPSVVRMVQSLISDAMQLGVTRILVLPVKDRLKVAYRIQNAVYTPEDPLAEMLYPLLVRLMTMSNLSGFIKVFVGEKERKLHVTFKAVRNGLSAVIDVAEDGSVAEAFRARAARLGYRFVDLDTLDIPSEVIDSVPEQIARENRVLPILLEEDALTIAVGEPQPPETLERLRFILNRPISVAMAPKGVILAALDRYYGHSDPETADLALWELAQSTTAGESSVPDTRSTSDRSTLYEGSDNSAGRPFFEHLRSFCTERMFGLFEEIRSSDQLCRQDSETGDLEVVFPHAEYMSLLPIRAREYIENKVWGIREAILMRFERFLDRDATARRLAMVYSQYLAGCRLAEGRLVSVNPASATYAWINFVHALTVQSFPSIDSNGALLNFVTGNLDRLSEKVAIFLSDPEWVVDPAGSSDWLARFERQTTLDEGLDFDSPSVKHLVDLLIAQAAHPRASELLLLPQEDRIETACRIRDVIYPMDALPLRLLYPVVARLRMLTDFSGMFRHSLGKGERRLASNFLPTEQGLAVRIDIHPEESALEACRAQAAEHGFDLADLEQLEIDPRLLKRIPKSVAWKKQVLPLTLHEGTTTIVVSTPPSPRRLDELRLLFNSAITVTLAPEDDLLAAIYCHYHPNPQPLPVSPLAIALLSEKSAE